MASEQARGRGRPRSEEADRAILEAALRLLSERGYARMSIAGVATAARIGKPAIYRRYRDRADLAAAALASLGGDVTAPIDTGETRADLTELLRRFLAAVGPGSSLFGSLLAEQDRHPELLAAFRERVTEPRRRLMRELLERGVERGDVRRDADLDLAADSLIGPYFSRQLSTLELPADWAERVVGATLEGLAPHGNEIFFHCTRPMEGA